MSAQRLLLPLLMVGLTSGASLPQGPRSHLGVCPNQLSPNLWVDAQSTCERECVGDQVSVGSVLTYLAGEAGGQETGGLEKDQTSPMTPGFAYRGDPSPRNLLPHWLPHSCQGFSPWPI